MNTEFSDDAKMRVSQSMNVIRRGCEKAMPIIGTNTRRKAVYWWDEDIADLRRECLRFRRRCTRARRRRPAVEEMQAFKQARKSLKKAISLKKSQTFEELRNDINANPYGLGYKVVMGKLNARKPTGVMNETVMKNIVDTLFPTHALTDGIQCNEQVTDFNPFNAQELNLAARALKSGKAPGPDGVPPEIMKEIADKRPDFLLRMYNACLRECIFPEIWKKQQLVLIKKDNGDPENPSSYRPLCMLDTAGKLMEKLLKPRLTTAIERGGGLSSRQYGFRPGRSTIDALREVIDAASAIRRGNHFSRPVVLLATLDVKNAFNSLRWKDVLGTLKDQFTVPHYILRMINSYLSDRWLTYNTSSGPRMKRITSGAAQGSILGPELWNASYDGILRVDMPEGAFLVGYADDIAAIITARDTDQAQRKLRRVMTITKAWLEDHGLNLATHKTELLLITGRHIPLQIDVRIANEIIKTKNTVKYLGLRLDSRLTYAEQIKYAAKKAQRTIGQLSRLMLNIGGPLPAKRRLLMEAGNSIILYGSEIWAEKLNVKCRAKVLVSVQRTAALRITSAYRTVSAPAVMVIAGTIPLDLLAEERRKNYEDRRTSIPDISSTRQATITKWQQRWNEEIRGRWTARLITNIKLWIDRKVGEVDYYVTQMLSGHGYFKHYLYRMGKCDSPFCRYEEEDVVDDVEHTIFHCTRWYCYRSQLIAILGTITAENIVEKMIANLENWDLVANFVKQILKTKKKDLDADEDAGPGRRQT